MKKPEMILFDYGQTLVGESKYNHIKGFENLLLYAKHNPDNITAEELASFYNSMRERIWCDNSANVEPHSNFLFRYIAEYFDIGFDISYDRMEQIFWDTAVEFEIMENIDIILDELYKKGIRTAVISNIDYSERTLERIINRFLPNNHFEFIIASSEYIFRKPDKELFDLAAKKAKISLENSWFCGNDEYYDVEGAAKNGLRAFWYTGSRFYKPKRKPECDYTLIENWLDLLKEIN